MTDMAWITAGGFCTLIITQVVNLYTQNRNRKWDLQDRVLSNKKVSQVASDLEHSTTATDKKLDALAIVAEATHTLVNSNMAVQLKLTAELSRWKADQTNDPEHILAAEHAERLLKEHEHKQALVDSQYGSTVWCR